MRIIGGEFRSRKLLAPATDATRPITDRVKQSLFDILSPRLADARVYDCFAGTGSMGLECLSRGAAHVTFFEADRSAVALLRKNIAALNVQARCNVVDRDLFRWFDDAPSPPAAIDIIFLDPPYRFLTERPADLRRVASRMSEHLRTDGIVLFRHAATDTLELAPLEPFDRREYGGMTIDLLRPPVKGDADEV